MEYYKIVSMLETLCMSEPGKALAEQSEPYSDTLIIAKLQDETAGSIIIYEP